MVVRPDSVIAGLLDRHDASARRLIVSVFGDAVVPRGGVIWLSDLISLMAAFEVNERSVRTSVQRLVSEGFLHNARIGRRSRYSVAPAAAADVDDADRRIYGASHPTWDGRWTVAVVIGHLSASDRERLGWRGLLAAGDVLVSPTLSPERARRAVADLGRTDEVVVLDATTGHDGDRHLADAAFHLEPLAEAYERLLDEPLLAPLSEATPEEAFALRVLLVDQYRRVLLRDPDLPADLLPSDWVGHRVRRAVADRYRELWEPAEAFVDATATELPRLSTRLERFTD